MVIHTVHPESVNSNILLQSEKHQEMSGNVALTFQQGPEVYRPHVSTSLNSNSQQVLHISPEKKPATPSFASMQQLNAAVCNASASSSLFGTPNVANPFVLAALLSMQQNSVASPLSNNIQAFNALIPYLQQVPNNAQSEYLMQNILALQHMAAVQQLAATSQQNVLPQQQQQPQPQQQQSSQQWISLARSVASGSDSVPSLPLSTSEDSLSVLSESSHVSPRPRSGVISPDKDGQLMISEDEYVLESLIEARKGLSEKESIAVAVLAGMAGYQR